MCGIFCAINLKENYDRKDFEKFKNLTDIVSYRGPDASNYMGFNTLSKEINNDKFNVFLGHRRLSILDLSINGMQPMCDVNNYIIFNGEIFNYIELREDFIKKNTFMNTGTDTEVILKVYRYYGEKGFNKLNGMWAFVIVDLNKNKIIVSRDRFSIKPLFYTRIGSSIFFASEIKQLLPLISQKQINKKVMARFLQQGLLDIDNHTFFDNIFKVNSKSNLIIDLTSTNIKEEKYWDYELEPSDNFSFEDTIEKFRELFTDSVKIRLRSDVEVGILLSGGLDSSAISLISSKILKDKLRTFSVITSNKKYSEEKFVDALVNSNGLINTKYEIRPDEIIKTFDKVIYHQDEPFNSFVSMAHYSMLSTIKRNSNITVVLNGQGGDEVLLGYLRFFFFYLKELKTKGNYLKAFSEIISSILNRTIIMQYRISIAKRYLPNILEKDKNFLKIKQPLENTWGNKSIVEHQINDIDKFSIPILTRYEDRNSMANSLEIRLPFLDHRLVNFLLSIPTQYKINRGWNKYILRKSLENLPDTIKWRRDKKGFILPEKTWLKVDFKESIFTTFNNSMLSKLGFINDKLFVNYYESFLRGNIKIHQWDISRVFIAEKWLKKILAE